MKKYHAKKAVAMLLALVVFATATLFAVPTFAADSTYVHLNGESYTLEKVSNPGTGEGEVDGLMPGGHRASSYCWAMAENNGYVYIGTWPNGLYQIIAPMGQTVLSKDMVDKLMLAFTNGEIDPCEENSTSNAKIYRYSETTGEMELLFDPDDYESGNYSKIYGFRGATTFKGDVYMDAMLNSSATDCQLWRVTDEDPYATPEVVLVNGSLRAICVGVDGEHMYTGGSCEVPEGYKSGAVVFATDTGDAGDFDTIADSKDFEYYTRNGASITVNDVAAFPNSAYEGGEEVIASLVTSFGVAVFRGHRASAEETAAGLANPYGWVWSEFIGVDGEYPISLGNLRNVTLTPAVFNGELYFLSMTNPMTPLITAFLGLVSANTTALYSGIDQLAATLDSECAVYRYTSDGRMQMVMGDRHNCPDSLEYVAKLGAGFNDDELSTSLYAWRSVTYNDRMYVNTIDVWNMYSYFTKLTNGQLLGMDKDDMEKQLGYISDLISTAATQLAGQDSFIGRLLSWFKGAQETVESSSLLQKLLSRITQPAYDTLYSIYSLIDRETTTETLEQIVANSVRYSELLNSTAETLTELIERGYFNSENCEIAQTAVDCINKLNEPFAYIAENKTHIENYMTISNVCANHETPGGEVWCTENGVDWEPITVDGFGDKYNHGIRTMAVGSDGSFYLGTANPYYGAQLWKLTDTAAVSAPEEPSPAVSEETSETPDSGAPSGAAQQTPDEELPSAEMQKDPAAQESTSEDPVTQPEAEDTTDTQQTTQEDLSSVPTTQPQSESGGRYGFLEWLKDTCDHFFTASR